MYTDLIKDHGNGKPVPASHVLVLLCFIDDIEQNWSRKLHDQDWPIHRWPVWCQRQKWQLEHSWGHTSFGDGVRTREQRSCHIGELSAEIRVEWFQGMFSVQEQSYKTVFFFPVLKSKQIISVSINASYTESKGAWGQLVDKVLKRYILVELLSVN